MLKEFLFFFINAIRLMAFKFQAVRETQYFQSQRAFIFPRVSRNVVLCKKIKLALKHCRPATSKLVFSYVRLHRQILCKRIKVMHVNSCIKLTVNDMLISTIFYMLRWNANCRSITLSFLLSHIVCFLILIHLKDKVKLRPMSLVFKYRIRQCYVKGLW